MPPIAACSSPRSWSWKCGRPLPGISRNQVLEARRFGEGMEAFDHLPAGVVGTLHPALCRGGPGTRPDLVDAIVGPKSATDLLKQFGSIDQIYARPGEVKSERIRASLLATEAHVRRNQKLIRLPTDLPCAFDLDTLAVRPGDPQQLAPLFERWGFKTMLAQLESAHSLQKELL